MAASWIPTAATRSHNSTTFGPTSGRSAIHGGTAGALNDASDFTHTTISSTFETIVPMANVRGTTNTHKSKSVINVTASARLPQSHDCAAIMSGHVATTIVVAHTIAPRNGRKIQMEDPIRATIKRTASTPRVISRSVMARVSERPLNGLCLA